MREVKKAGKDFEDRFDSDNVGELVEYVGCKIEFRKDERSIRFTQPVMLKSFVDEFDLSNKKSRLTPADPGTILVQADESYIPDSTKHKYFRSGVGKLLYMTRWSRPDIQNAV